MKKIFTATIMGMAFMSFAAFADDSDGPTIDGAVEQTITATDDIAAAIGDESSATQEIGTIDSGNLEGEIAQTVIATDDIAASIGEKTCVDQKIGTIGSKNAC